MLRRRVRAAAMTATATRIRSMMEMVFMGFLGVVFYCRRVWDCYLVLIVW